MAVVSEFLRGGNGMVAASDAILVPARRQEEIGVAHPVEMLGKAGEGKKRTGQGRINHERSTQRGEAGSSPADAMAERSIDRRDERIEDPPPTLEFRDRLRGNFVRRRIHVGEIQW